MSFPSSHEFTEIFHTRRAHFAALLDLSRRQRALIAGGDYTQLLVVLGQKQRLLGRLDQLARSQPGMRERWQEQRRLLDAGTREACDRLLAESESLLAALIDEEQSSTEELTTRRDDTQRQLEAISQGAQVHGAYRDQLAPATHRHLDVGR